MHAFTTLWVMVDAQQSSEAKRQRQTPLDQNFARNSPEAEDGEKKSDKLRSGTANIYPSLNICRDFTPVLLFDPGAALLLEAFPSGTVLSG